MVSQAIRSRLIDITADSPVSAVDLFGGAGGLTHGLLRGSIKVKAGIGIDPKTEYAYSKNNPIAEFLYWDVSQENYTSVKKLFTPRKYRLLAGCTLCQLFSKLTNGIKKHRSWDLLDACGKRDGRCSGHGSTVACH